MDLDAQSEDSGVVMRRGRHFPFDARKGRARVEAMSVDAYRVEEAAGLMAVDVDEDEDEASRVFGRRVCFAGEGKRGSEVARRKGGIRFRQLCFPLKGGRLAAGTASERAMRRGNASKREDREMQDG